MKQITLFLIFLSFNCFAVKDKHFFNSGIGFGQIISEENGVAEQIYGIDLSYTYYPIHLTISTMTKLYCESENFYVGQEFEILTYYIAAVGIGIEYSFEKSFSYHLFFGVPISTLTPIGVFNFIYFEPYVKVHYQNNLYTEMGILFKSSLGF